MAAEAKIVDLCDLREVPDEASRGFDLQGSGRDTVFVVRRGGTLNAYLNVCPHQGSSLPWQKNAYLSADKSRIVCSAHGAEFDIETGRCTRGAALGRSLEPVEVVVTKAGKVAARLKRDLLKEHGKL